MKGIRYSSPYLHDMTDAEVSAKLKWLRDRLPMTTHQIVKRAIVQYYEKHLAKWHPTLTELRQQLLKEQKGECYYCHKYLDFRFSTVDHKKALYRGGTFDRDNLCVACARCNSLKGHMNETEYKALMEKFSNVLLENKKQSDAPSEGFVQPGTDSATKEQANGTRGLDNGVSVPQLQGQEG